MDHPGGRPTPGLEEAVRLLAAGETAEIVMREVLKVATREAGGNQALALARQGDRIIDLAAHCVPDPCLRSAVAEALAKGATVRRSNPVAGLNAGAVPVIARGEVIGALGVAGTPDRLDPRPLDTAASIMVLCLSRQGMAAQSGAPFESLAPLATAATRSEVAAATLEVVRRFTTGPAFVCLEEAGRLQVARYQGIAHDDLAALVARTEFLELITRWNDRPVPRSDPEVLDLGGHAPVLVCAPLPDRLDAHHLLGAIVLSLPPNEADAARRLLSAIAPHVSSGLARAQDAVELQRRDREVDGLVQANVAPVVVLDAQGRFLRVNAAACDVLGLSGSFDCGRDARGNLGDPALERLVLDTEGPGEIDLEFGSPPRQFRASVTRVNDGPERLRTMVVLEDISARRRHEQAHDEFVSVIGHELRTPLTVAKGFIETVLGRHDALEPEQQKLFLQRSLVQTERLEDLINDLLFISTERPRDGASFESHDVMALAADVAARFAARHPDRTIDCLALSGETAVRTDRRLVMHALRHLIDNALKYSDGPVRVEVSSDGGSVEIAVADQGPGIFSGDLDRLLQPFEQLDSSSTRRQGGAGLGLYLCRRLVEALGGRLDCDTRLGQGSRFSFRLPSRAAEPSLAARVRDDAPS